MSILDSAELHSSTIEVEEALYDINEPRESFEYRMKAEGYTIVYPEVDELQIDIDCEDHYNTFKKSWAIMSREFPDASIIYDKPSRSGFPSRHIIIRLPFTLNAFSRIAFQAALGSDPVRELLSSIREYRGDDHPTLFLEKSK